LQTLDVALTNVLNAHFPPDLPSHAIHSYAGHQWLPPAFFDEEDPQHPHLALTMLMNWIQGPNRFKHVPSGTWQGGPNGARWIVAVVARIVTTFTMIALESDIPEAIMKIIDTSSFQHLQVLLKSFCQWLIRSFRETCKTLKATQQERLTSWKTAVVLAYLNQQATEDLPREIVRRQSQYGSGQALTNGVPVDPQELEQCFKHITETNPELTLGAKHDHVSLLQQLSHRVDGDESEAEFSDASSSGEEITLLDIGSDTHSESEASMDASVSPVQITPTNDIEKSGKKDDLCYLKEHTDFTLLTFYSRGQLYRGHSDSPLLHQSRCQSFSCCCSSHST
jgi:hypothetical protein